MIKAVLFDMDGLMIDSEPLHYQAFNKVFQEFGKELPEAVNNEKYVGISDKDVAQDMVVRFNLSIAPEEVVAKEQEYYMELLQHHVGSQPGLLDLLQDLKKNNYRTAIASGSTVSEIEAVMGALHIEKFIDAYVSADEVEKGKPAPDIFLLAAKRLGCKPHECLVLEDAPSGLKGAITCGMQCFIIPSNQTKGKDFTGATKMLGSLSEVFQNME